VNRKSKSKYGEKFPMRAPIAQMRAELKKVSDPIAEIDAAIEEAFANMKPVVSSPAERIPEIVSGTKIAPLAEPVPTDDPGDGLVQPLPGEREPMFL
jgi:hypothetical protein